ncbi:MAG: F0F1 ATP synthase subunit delta, partial [Candidatus Aminicenantales bacterium]
MIKQVLIRRYGQGLINVLQDEADFRKVREELRELTGLFFEHKKFRQALASPFMSKTKKTGL